MPRVATRHDLKASTIQNAKPGAIRREIADAHVPGLRLLVRPSGHKSFVLRFTYRHEYCKVTLASPVTALAAARDEARAMLQAVAAGDDPRHAKRSGDAPDGSFETRTIVQDGEAIGKGYLELHVAQLREGTQLYVRRELDRMVRAWSGRPLRSITKKDCFDLIDGAATRGATASNATWKVCKALFAWLEQREDNFVSPARTIKRPNKEVKRDRVLDDAELAMIWRKAGEIGGPSGALVKLLMLTGARRDEIAGLRWDEVKPDRISLPRERTKTDAAHDIYLTDAMRKVLKPFKREGRYVLGDRDRPIRRTGASRMKSMWPFHTGAFTTCAVASRPAALGSASRRTLSS